jgi:hypothetical protein
MSRDFILFVSSIRDILSATPVKKYMSIIGSENKRIMTKSYVLPDITIDINGLEESGCDILFINNINYRSYNEKF